MSDALTVPQLNDRLKRLIEADPALNDVWVTGEISDWRRIPSSGHCYFSLKASDGSGQMIKGVMWRMNADRQARLGGLPQNGDAVQALGSVRLYENRSEYQLSVLAIQPIGVGALYAEFERLRLRLAAEGLFDEARKRPLPQLVQRIGIVTSPEAAVFQDVQQVLRRRYPLAALILSPCPVQGSDAPPQIVRAIERLNDRADVDVILVCRGGGSLEDLWCFNDERVARAIAASRIPVVSGVGHETDFTLADFAADVRAPTPSAAAEIVTPDIDALRAELRLRRRQLDSAMSSRIDALRRQTEERAGLLQRLSPAAQFGRYRQRLDDWSLRAGAAVRSRIQLLRAQLDGKAAALAAVDPRALLKRGYAIVTLNDSTRITSAAQNPPPGTAITLHFHDGDLTARIEDRELHGRYSRTLF
jgi:exodeoxyribonuclease VII large subunit